MSLQHVAKHLASKGRGEDKVLVHMTPREVKGLQSLAMAHGGSLTINPETGLAEAGFLRNLLPMIAGAALASTGIGAPMAAAMIGGGTALAKGDLKAGLMAGLGAYGGAGLMGGAATMGAQAAGETAGAEALGTTPEIMSTEGGSQAALTTNPAVNPQGFDAFGNTPSTTVQGGYDPSTSGSYIDPAKGAQYSDAYAKAAQPSFANTQTGVQQAFNDPSKYVDATGGGMQTAKYGISALGASASPDRQMLPEEEKYDGPLSKYKFDPNQYRSSDRSQPNPYYQARMYNYAGGGPVEQMSNANAIGQNTGYPMADINKAAYSTPYQTPVSQNVVQGTSDTGVDSMTGEQSRFAEGGITGSGNLDLHIPLDLGGGGQGGGQGGFGGGGQGGGAFGVGNGGGGQSQSAFGQGFQGSSMPGFGGGQPNAFGGGLGLQSMAAQLPQDPFANDNNFKNYQNQMQGMVKDFEGSDQYKNMMSLNETMRNYQQQRLGTAGSPSLNTPDLQAAARAAYNPNNSTPYAGQRMAQPPNMNMGMNPGLYGGQPQKTSYDQYAEGNNRRLAEKSQIGSAASMTHDYVGPTMSRADFDAFQNAPKNPAASMAAGGMAYAQGGISSLGGYSDGGRMLKGPGDGMSDNIPAQIGSKQPARLADGEFVVSADVVSGLGNGSTDAGARQLYAMMDRVRKARTGTKKMGKAIKADKLTPA